MFKKIICLALAAVMLMSVFSACKKDEPSNSISFGEKSDYTKLDGYYLSLQSEVKNDKNVTVEKDFLVFLDEELTKLIGTMNVAFNADGSLSGYQAAIGILQLEKLISYSKSESSATYTEMEFSEPGVTKSVVWENIFGDPETGEGVIKKGNMQCYNNGNYKHSYEEEYTFTSDASYLSATTECDYSEDGARLTENIIKYDEKGNVK